MPCEEIVQVETFREALADGWDAICAGRPDEAREQTLQLERQIACLGEPLQAPDAAAFHRNKAMGALRAGDERGALAAVGAAILLGGDTALWGEQSADFAELAQRGRAPTMNEEFGTSLAAKVFVDGGSSPRRPLGTPVIVQIFTPSGEPVAGAWVDGRDVLPDWVAFPPVQCADDVPIDTLLDQAQRAERAYAELDVATFEASLQSVAAGLPCVTGRIGMAQAAAIHRLEGIRQFTYGAETAAVRSFQEARALDPAYVPAESMIRPGSTLASLWELSGRTAPSPWLAQEVPPRLTLLVDGMITTVRPAVLPSIVQLSAPSGEILWTRYVPPGAVLPDLAPFEARADQLEEEMLPPALRLYREVGRDRLTSTKRGRLVVGGIGLLTGSAALYIANANAVIEYFDPETASPQLPGLKQRANLTASGSSLLLLGGTSLLVASFLVD